MKNILLILLVIIAIAMLAIGIFMKIMPPALTGIGFILIAILFHKKD
jgi:small-conductance mechanosensitive channel